MRWDKVAGLSSDGSASMAASRLAINSKMQVMEVIFLLQLKTFPRRFHTHQTNYNFKFKFLNLVFCFLFSALYFLCPPSAAAEGTATVAVGWDASTPTVAGYEIYYGSISGQYDHVVDVGNNTSCSISGLVEETTYYFAVKAYDSEGYKSEYSEELIHTVESSISNNSPTISITSPANGASFDSGAIISFDGAASDYEDGVLTGDMVWVSDLQGQIATGGSFTALLSDGTHTITAEVMDSGGFISSESTTITVGGGSNGNLTLSVNAYKIKGDKYADLTWSGATSTNLDVYHDGGKIATTANSGAYKHGPFSKGKPATYQVCEAATSICSNTVSVSW